MPAAPGAVAPAGADAFAARVRDAAARRAALVPRGSGQWWAEPAPGVEPLELSALDAVSDFNPADLVVTAGAGVPLGRLAERLAARGAWLPFDPPGPASRTVGGALASGGGGPLAAHYGPARDHVLGLVVVAGDGTVVRLGGRVVKNVAGFDLAKLVIGGHGAFGVIVEAHLRLRARPAADRTWVWRGAASRVQRAGAAALATASSPAALEVVNPDLALRLGWADGDAWALAARAVGSAAGVEEELEAVARATGARPALALEGEAPWLPWRLAVGEWPAVLRLGAEPSGWTEAADLAAARVGPPCGVSVTVPRGTVRIGVADVTAEAVRRLRDDAAARGWPVTLERAAPALRAAVGVWGALPPTVERLTRAARACFDPPATFAVPLLA